MSVCCGLSGRGLCDGSISGLEESYRVWCLSVSVCVRRGGGGGARD
jgi:hypothetical protein